MPFEKQIEESKKEIEQGMREAAVTGKNPKKEKRRSKGV